MNNICTYNMHAFLMCVLPSPLCQSLNVCRKRNVCRMLCTCAGRVLWRTQYMHLTHPRALVMLADTAAQLPGAVLTQPTEQLGEGDNTPKHRCNNTLQG
jgi:hypothetical protein